MIRRLIIIITLVLICLGVFLFFLNSYNFIINFAKGIKNVVSPARCATTINFSIGSLDPRFNINQAALIADVEEAGSSWEKAIGKNLFQYDATATGSLKVNLIYDERQQITDELKQQNTSISDDKATYTALKSKYDSLLSSYDTQKASYEKALAGFQSRQKNYDQRLSLWKKQGSNPGAVYTALEKERISLNAEIAALNQEKDAINLLSDQINALVQILNGLVKKLNLKVATFNTVSSSNSEEFSEGEYISDSAGTRINIYQFENNAQLVVLLEHELGHALGLGHVADPNAVMYRLNISQKEALAPADISALNQACGN